MTPIPSLGLPLLADILILIVLLIIGLVIIIVVAKVLLFFLPAAIVAAVVWFLSDGSLFWTGVAFIAVALLSLLRRR